MSPCWGYLSGEQTFGRQRVLPSAVGKEVVLSFQHREPAGQEQAAVEELEMGAAARRLAGVHADVIQHVSEHGLQRLRELLRRPLVKHLLQAQHVHVGGKQRGHLPGDAALLTEALGQQRSGSAPVARVAPLVGVLVGVKTRIRLRRRFLRGAAGRGDRVIGGPRGRGMDLGRVGALAPRGLGRGERAVGWAESPAAAGGVYENANIGAAHSLSDALTDGGRPVLGVPQVVETSQAVRQQAQVSCGEPKRGSGFQLQDPAGVLL